MFLPLGVPLTLNSAPAVSTSRYMATRQDRIQLPLTSPQNEKIKFLKPSRLILVIVDQINIVGVAFLKSEDDAPVRPNSNAPEIFKIAR